MVCAEADEAAAARTRGVEILMVAIGIACDDVSGWMSGNSTFVPVPYKQRLLAHHYFPDPIPRFSYRLHVL